MISFASLCMVFAGSAAVIGRGELLGDNGLQDQSAVVEESSISSVETSDSTYNTIKLFNDQFSVAIPAGFTLMDSAAMVAKYPDPTRPNIIYTNQNGSVNITFKYTSNRMPPDGVPELMPVLLRSIVPVSVRFYRASIENVNSREFGILEALTPIAKGRVYNFMYATALNGKVLVGTVNCPEGEKEAWKKEAKKIVESIGK